MADPLTEDEITALRRCEDHGRLFTMGLVRVHHYETPHGTSRWETRCSPAGDVLLATLDAERARREAAEARVKHLEEGLTKSNDDICQTLGRALGYPRFADSQDVFPGATDGDGVCVGDQVAESIAAEAARTLADERRRRAAAEAEREALREWISKFAHAVGMSPNCGSGLPDWVGLGRAILTYTHERNARLKAAEAELDRLREALAPFAEHADALRWEGDDVPVGNGLTMADCRRARAALGGDDA